MDFDQDVGAQWLQDVDEGTVAGCARVQGLRQVVLRARELVRVATGSSASPHVPYRMGRRGSSIRRPIQVDSDWLVRCHLVARTRSMHVHGGITRYVCTGATR